MNVTLDFTPPEQAVRVILLAVGGVSAPPTRRGPAYLDGSNLTTNERALIAAKMANLNHGGDRLSETKGAETPLVSIYQAAELMGVSRGTVVSEIIEGVSTPSTAVPARGAA